MVDAAVDFGIHWVLEPIQGDDGTVSLHSFPVKHNLPSSILHKRVYQNSGVAYCLAMDFDVQCLSYCVLPSADHCYICLCLLDPPVTWRS